MPPDQQTPHPQADLINVLHDQVLFLREELQRANQSNHDLIVELIRANRATPPAVVEASPDTNLRSLKQIIADAYPSHHPNASHTDQAA